MYDMREDITARFSSLKKMTLLRSDDGFPPGYRINENILARKNHKINF